MVCIHAMNQVNSRNGFAMMAALHYKYWYIIIRPIVSFYSQ